MHDCTIIQYLKHIEQSKEKVRTKFPTNLSISATKKSKVIKIKSCFHHLFRVHVLSLFTVSAILYSQPKLGSPTFKALQKIGTKKKSFWWLAQWKSWLGKYFLSYNPGGLALNCRNQRVKHLTCLILENVEDFNHIYLLIRRCERDTDVHVQPLPQVTGVDKNNLFRVCLVNIYNYTFYCGFNWIECGKCLIIY